MLRKRPLHIRVAEIVPPPPLEHGLFVPAPGFDENRVEAAEELPGGPGHDGEDGGVHGGEPFLDGAVGEDEFGVGVGAHEFVDHAGGGEVHDGLVLL
ncbi:hypothetical protein HO133_009458 [Letharia lupina]|uniref:Uncharacterized protein n=1 Tax=Letharia lupina TaxID=560253 RepID=A0A8H6CL44_9LECA|nr:uncharacterized protein HO133_009458 [Letharia lupina]KAF6225458.1 hypothetical protein HO133_009458 [Letharia lupina]